MGTNEAAQHLRFRVFSDMWRPQDRSVLDFGCGLGDLYHFYQTLGLKVKYAGVDINDDFVAEAQRRYPGARLEVRDVMAEGLDRSYDLILAIGVYCYRLRDNLGFIRDTFRLFREQARIGFAASFLREGAGPENRGLFYTSPTAVIAEACTVSPKIALRADYLPTEFAVFVDCRLWLHWNTNDVHESLGMGW